jgi:Ca-activated chloride channel family protein
MDVNYSYKYVDLLIVLVGLVLVIYFLSKRFVRQRMMRFGNFEVLEKVYHPPAVNIASLIPLVLRVLAITLIILALSDIELVEDGYLTNTDYVLAIDTSSSMLTPDYEPNRLALAKQSSIDWITKLRETRIGVVTFAGRPYTQIEPTTNLESVVKTIDRITLDQPAGTAIGDALITSSSLLRGLERNKTIILITDGQNNIGVNISDSLRSLKKDNIKIIALGIGASKGEVIAIPEELSGMNVTAAQSPDLDEETLKYLANETGGAYFQIHDPNSFKTAFESGVESQKVTKEVQTYLLFAVCALLLLEWAFEITRIRPIP